MAEYSSVFFNSWTFFPQIFRNGPFFLETNTTHDDVSPRPTLERARFDSTLSVGDGQVIRPMEGHVARIGVLVSFYMHPGAKKQKNGPTKKGCGAKKPGGFQKKEILQHLFFCCWKVWGFCLCTPGGPDNVFLTGCLVKQPFSSISPCKVTPNGGLGSGNPPPNPRKIQVKEE